MSRFLPTLLAALVLALLLARVVLDFRALSREPELEFTGPGEFSFAVPAASDYTVWHKATASISGVYSVREPRLPAGTQIAVEHAGAIVPAKANGGNYTSGTETGEKFSVLSFTAAEPGNYTIKVTGFEETRAFSVTRGTGVGPILAIIGWLLAAGFAGLAVIALLILALTGKFPHPPAPPVLTNN